MPAFNVSKVSKPLEQWLKAAKGFEKVSNNKFSLIRKHFARYEHIMTESQKGDLLGRLSKSHFINYVKSFINYIIP